MNLIPHIKAARRGIRERIKVRTDTNTLDLEIGIMSGLSGSVGDIRYLKIDERKDPVHKHSKSRKIVHDFVLEYHGRYRNDTRLAAGAVCELYHEGKLTKTVNPYKHQKPEIINPVGLVNDPSTGGQDIESQKLGRVA